MDNPKTDGMAQVKLNTPIKRGDEEITEVSLRKPLGGDLRGLSLNEVLQSDFVSLAKLVPRISTPALHEHEMDTMPADDIAEIGGTIFGFFMTPAQKAALKKITG